MLKRITKVTSLLVTAASIVSMVPAVAADVKKIEGQEGTVYGAKADIGKYFIDAELNGDDEAVYYITNGEYTKLENAETGDLTGDVDVVQYEGNTYVEMADGDYYIDLKTGKRTDDDIKGNIEDDKAELLRKNIKNDDDGRFAKSTYTGNIIEKDDVNIYGPTGIWSQFSYDLKNPLTFGDYTKDKSSIYASREGGYYDGDYNVGKLGIVTTGAAVTIDGNEVTFEDTNITIRNTEDTYEVEDTDGNEYELKALVTNPASQGESNDYLSRTIDLSIWAKVKGEDDDTYTNITSSIEFGSSTNHHEVPLSGTSDEYGDYVTVMQKMSKDSSSDDIDGIKYAKSTILYFMTDEDGVSQKSDMLAIVGDTICWQPGNGTLSAQTVNLKSKNGYNYMEVEDSDEIDVDDWTIGCGELYALSEGYVKKFIPSEKEFVKLYKVDGGMNKIKVGLQYNVIVWNEDDEIYSVIDEPLPWATADTTKTDEKTDTTETSSKTKGWIKAADGTWNYVKVDGTKATGWLQDRNTWYYLKADGIMATGWVNDAGTWYYLNASGAMQTGWINDNGTWYYCNESGAMLANTAVAGYVLGADGAWVK